MAGEPSLHDALTRPHERVGRYRLLARLAEGGMGVVYLAEDTALDRRVALKVLVPALRDNAVFRDRFVRESRLAAAIEHPGIVPIYEAGEADGTLFIAMRFVDGPDLRELLAAEGPLDVSRAIDLVSQVAAALDAAHRVGLVHRDVKPGNVMIDRAGGAEHCYLTDFGLTKNISTTSGYASTGGFVGTLHYVAPEQLQGGPARPQADVYALGCVLFECLTGSVPFPRDHEVAVMYAHMNDPAPSARELRPQMPAGIDPVIARALAKAVEDRYATCGELAADAKRALEGAAIPPFVPSLPRSRRFTRPEPPVVAAAPAAAPAPPAEPVAHVRAPRRPSPPAMRPAPVAPQPLPRKSEKGPLRAAAIVAAAILLCAGGIVAALVLTGGGSDGATSKAQRIVNRTIELNRQLKQEVTRLQHGRRDDAKLRARLVEDEQRAKELQSEANDELAGQARLRDQLTSVNQNLYKAAIQLKQYSNGSNKVPPSHVGAALNGDIHILIKVKQQLPTPTAGTSTPETPAPQAPGASANSVRLPSGATVRIRGDSITSASGGGDFNGDGNPDLLVQGATKAYVLFGPVPGGSIDLGSLGSAGFEVDGGMRARPVGDVNGDGNDDVGVLAAQDGQQTAAYVIFGRDSSATVAIPDVADRGVQLQLPASAPEGPEDSFSSESIAAAGDVNGDGSPDLLVADPASLGGGAAWVVYGGDRLTDGAALDSLTGQEGFAIKYSNADGGAVTALGASAVGAGDLNGDGFDDVVVGDPYADGGAGAAYVVFGSDNGSDVDPSDLGGGGFALRGRGNDHAGGTLAALEDFDGDGHPDVLAGAPGASPSGRKEAGAAYVVRGGQGTDDVDLHALGSSGVEIAGPAPARSPGAQYSGSLAVSAASAGDVDGDGKTDVVLGAGGLRDPAAAAYVVYGGDASAIDLRAPAGRALAIEANGDGSPVPVGGGSDFSGDGHDDAIVVIGPTSAAEADVIKASR